MNFPDIQQIDQFIMVSFKLFFVTRPFMEGFSWGFCGGELFVGWLICWGFGAFFCRVIVFRVFLKHDHFTPRNQNIVHGHSGANKKTTE